MSALDLGRHPTTAWEWPIDLNRYDRCSELSAGERACLGEVVEKIEAHVWIWDSPRPAALERLLCPLDDVATFTDVNARTRREATNTLLCEMYHCNQAFWGWTNDKWIAIFDRDHNQSLYLRPRDYRQYLFTIGYLLCGFTDFFRTRAPYYDLLAKKVFGEQRAIDSAQSVYNHLLAWGYSGHHTIQGVYRAMYAALVFSRSPHVEDISRETLAILQEQCPTYLNRSFVLISRVLKDRGIVSEALPAGPNPSISRAGQDVHPEWMSWVERWRNTSSLAPASRKRNYYYLMQSGRWLAANHPNITHPKDWTRSIGAEFVAAVSRLNVGDWGNGAVAVKYAGKPLSAAAKAHYLTTMGTFFRDCQEWEWIPKRFEPRRVFATPRAIRATMGPSPRVIADDIWAKLLWAGLNLTPDDLPHQGGGATAGTGDYCYPLEMIQAIAMVWLFAGLRANEIQRLRVGSIRWQADGLVVPAEDGTLPRGVVCLLEVPTSKTSPPFVKPVDRYVGLAIEAWERIRPIQPLLTDLKTGQMVNLLFTYRGKAIGRGFISDSLIPILCRKSGAPSSDTRGPITSHRARSTIATQLYNADEPLTLFELQAWLGHKWARSTQYYAQVTPTRLTKSYQRAGYLDRNLRAIAVLVDQEAVLNGAAANGKPWKYYDLGHGYCAYNFFHQCPFRMACAKCDFYIPKESSKGHLLEAKGNLLRMLQEIPLRDEERSAIEDGIEAVEKLLVKLADVPTPAGPTPRQLGMWSADALWISPNDEKMPNG